MQTWCPHSPHPKQAEFLASSEQEVLFGGAAGGGKSDALLMAALQYVDVPSYSALLLRRTFADLSLPGAIMDRATTWLENTPAHWDGLRKRWTFPSGASLSFGYLDTDRDRFRYQGAELQFVGFDELTQFPEAWYRYLFSRLRKPNSGPLSAVPLRMRGATNPGGLGHEWVRRRFVDADALARFIPSKLEDNPSLDMQQYEESLSRLDSVTKKQLRDGVWTRDSSGLVYRYDPSRNDARNVPPLEGREGWRYVLGIDYGHTDACAYVVWGWAPHETTLYCVHAEKIHKQIPSESAEHTKALMMVYNPESIVGDIGGLGKGYIEEARVRWGLPIEAAEKQNKAGYIKLFNGDLESGRVKVADGCDALVSEWLELPWADEGRTKESDGFDNHAADAALYGWRRCLSFLESAVPKPVLVGSAEWEQQQRELRQQAVRDQVGGKQPDRGQSAFWRRR